MPGAMHAGAVLTPHALSATIGSTPFTPWPCTLPGLMGSGKVCMDAPCLDTSRPAISSSSAGVVQGQGRQGVRGRK